MDPVLVRLFALMDAWRPSHRGRVTACPSCVSSPFYAMTVVARLPEPVRHGLLTELAAVAHRRVAELEDEFEAEMADWELSPFGDSLPDRLVRFARHAQEVEEELWEYLSRHETTIAAGIQRLIEPRIARFVAEASRDIDRGVPREWLRP